MFTKFNTNYCKFYASFLKMSTTVVIAGLGLAVIGYAGEFICSFIVELRLKDDLNNSEGRIIVKHAPKVAENLEKKLSTLPKITPPTFSSLTDAKYYKGGFESKMSKREAALILGVSPTANKLKIKEAHKRIMLLNHPDKGGSPFIASKLNEG